MESKSAHISVFELVLTKSLPVNYTQGLNETEMLCRMRSTVFYRRPLSWNPEIFPCQRFLYISVRRLSINYNRLFWREQPLNLSPGNSVRIENLVIRKSRTGLANDTYKIPGLSTDLEIAEALQTGLQCFDIPLKSCCVIFSQTKVSTSSTLGPFYFILGLYIGY